MKSPVKIDWIMQSGHLFNVIIFNRSKISKIGYEIKFDRFLKNCLASKIIFNLATE